MRKPRFVVSLICSAALSLLPQSGVAACQPCAHLLLDSVAGPVGGEPWIIGHGQYRVGGGTARAGLFINAGGKLWFYDGRAVLEIASGSGQFPLPPVGIYYTATNALGGQDIVYASGAGQPALIQIDGRLHDVLADGRVLVRSPNNFRLLQNNGSGVTLTGLAHTDSSARAMHAGGWIYELGQLELWRIREDGTGLSRVPPAGSNATMAPQKSFVTGSRLYFREFGSGLSYIDPGAPAAKVITDPEGLALDVSDLFSRAVTQAGTVGFARAPAAPNASSWHYWRFEVNGTAATALHRPSGGCSRGSFSPGIELKQQEVVFECTDGQLSWTDGAQTLINFAPGAVVHAGLYLENRPRGARLGDTLYAVIYVPSGIGMAALHPASGSAELLDTGVNVQTRLFAIGSQLVFAANSPATGTEIFTLVPDTLLADGFEAPTP